jgi:hypothetical protein
MYESLQVVSYTVDADGRMTKFADGQDFACVVMFLLFVETTHNSNEMYDFIFSCQKLSVGMRYYVLRFGFTNVSEELSSRIFNVEGKL